jgi:hypothetical protein
MHLDPEEGIRTRRIDALAAPVAEAVPASG